MSANQKMLFPTGSTIHFKKVLQKKTVSSLNSYVSDIVK